MSILTVTLNFALDVTYHVEAVRMGKTVRVDGVARRAGGKGVNAARVLHALRREAVVTGFAGGHTGSVARAELRSAGIRDATVDIEAESRMTFMVVDADGTATGFSERGPGITARDWSVLRDRFDELVGDAEAVVIAGSVPPGVPVDGCGQLVAAARRRGVPSVLDTDSQWLAAGLAAQPTVVKINRDELRDVAAHDDVVAGAAALREAGAHRVVITCGPDGLVAVGDDGVWRAAPPRAVRGNPTGAGDAASAALARALVDGRAWPEALADAVALSAAAVAAPQAGSFDAELYAELREAVSARPVR